MLQEIADFLKELVTVVRSVKSTIYNVTLTDANTEYSQLLPSKTKRFSVALRDTAAFRLAFEIGRVATPTAPYKTIPAGSEYYEDSVELETITLFLATPVAGKTAEIITWR